MEDERQELSPFTLSVRSINHEQRIKELESDMKDIKPIVYDTMRSVKAIEKSVEKMTENSEKIRGYFFNALIVGAVGIVYLALQSWMGGTP